jgi:twinkle protein
MAKGLGCQVIFIDPLSFIAAGLDTNNMVAALDRASRDLARLTKELRISLHISHHLARPEGVAHEEGGNISMKHVRGSGGIAHFASIVLGWERNQQSDHPNLTRIRVLKNRPISRTGIADVLEYNDSTGRLEETDKQWPKAAGRRDGGFGHHTDIQDF